MIALWIILGLIALIWLLLAIPLQIYLSYEQEELNYRIKYGPILLIDSLKPPKEKKPKAQPSVTDSEKKKKKSSGSVKKILDFLGLSEISSVANVKHSIAASGVVGTISSVFSAVKRLFDRIFRLIRKGVFKKFDLKIIVGDDDAAEAALLYGQICAAAFPLLNFLENSMRFRKQNVDIRCDYDLESTQVSFVGQLNYRPWHFVCFAMGLVSNYIKSTMKKGETS